MDDRVAVDRVLVPVDGTDNSLEAVEYAVLIADRYDANLSVMYVLDEETRRAIQSDAADSADDATIAEDMHGFLQQVRQQTAGTNVSMSTMTVYGFSTTRKTQHPGSVILDGADQIGSDFLVIPREPEYGVLSKAAGYVLSYASQPVLSV